MGEHSDTNGMISDTFTQVSGSNGRKRPERVQPLSVLPVFLPLSGRRAIIAGGTDAAAWKAELLAATGADVAVFSPDDEELSGDMRALLEEGRVRLYSRSWTVADFEGAAIAIADADSEEEAMAFADAAKAAGVPCNVIDKPAHCQFQFGTIVNRSPVVVGISTDGAAPILGQAIRRRIETLLPPSLKDWAGLARTLRDTVAEKLTPGPQRRAFWERFVDRSFGGQEPDAESVTEVHDDLSAVKHTDNGRVTLVGAGPGDAELLTLKAMRALQSADVILFDDLVSEEVLELARREAKRMLVGKRGGRESCKQDDINRMMLTFARQGKRVVRLKSGDPAVFGRAGEEIAFLERHGIAVDMVPGITAASAMASRLGVSLTHRDHAQSVRFVTGHSRHGALPADLDWRAIADPRTTTIFYMGGRTAGEISARLQEHGLDAQTPVAICSSVSRASEKRWFGTVAEMADGIGEIGYDEPVLIAVGGVFARQQQQAVALSA
jgi:uroporphyrin-III C-methyltransferase/precorrin-2 dehydrogenase/sirohydrochlorin ferrochelatase